MDFYSLVSKEMAQVEKDIQALIPQKPKEVYSFIPSFISRGGKRMRPLLSILCCNALGGNSQSVIRPAAILEVFHNFTLIHDDIEDNSLLRRGEPTLHITYGIPIALNSGDALYTSLWKSILSLPLSNDKIVELGHMYVKGFQDVVDGQGIELNWYHLNRLDISEEEYYSMAGGKTAALIGLSCALGANLAGAPKEDQERMRRFGVDIGLAFQIQDDVLNLTGVEEKYKKEIGGDIVEGKRTLMIIHALATLPKQKADSIRKILLSKEKSKKDVSFIIDLLVSSGSIEYAKEKASNLILDAKAQLSHLKDSPYKQALLAVSDFVTSREA